MMQISGNKKHKSDFQNLLPYYNRGRFPEMEGTYLLSRKHSTVFIRACCQRQEAGQPPAKDVWTGSGWIWRLQWLQNGWRWVGGGRGATCPTSQGRTFLLKMPRALPEWPCATDLPGTRHWTDFSIFLGTLSTKTSLAQRVTHRRHRESFSPLFHVTQNRTLVFKHTIDANLHFLLVSSGSKRNWTNPESNTGLPASALVYHAYHCFSFSHTGRHWWRTFIRLGKNKF